LITVINTCQAWCSVQARRLMILLPGTSAVYNKDIHC
jgi:hypothetical protein